jgi:hypothetical protein
MKTYIVTTGLLFCLITVAHIARIVAERHLARDPWYLLLTIAAAVLAIWAWRLVRASAGTRDQRGL